MAEIDVINQQRTSSGQSTLLPPLEHLWVFNDNGHEVTRERMSDLLNRRRDFHSLEDYCQMHQVDPQLFQIDRPFYAPTARPAWIMGGVRLLTACSSFSLLTRFLVAEADDDVSRLCLPGA